MAANSMIWAIGVAMTLGVVAAASAASETHTAPFAFPLAPGDTTLLLPQFDEQGGVRTLDGVTISVSAVIGAQVTAENDSVLPAPEFALHFTGLLTVDVVDVGLFSGLTATGLTDGSVMPADGTPDAGRDYWDFGLIAATANEVSVSTSPLPFVGTGTVPAVVYATGGFTVSGATDSTIAVSEFAATGIVTVTYEYTNAPTEACCLTDGSCVDVAAVSCAALGGTGQGLNTSCGFVPCPQPAPPADGRGSCSEKGSLLIFPKVELRWDAQGSLLQDTFITLTNDFNQDVDVLLYFVNGDAPLPVDLDTGERAHPGWNWLDNGITLTANEPAYWSVLSGQPKGVAPFLALDPGFPPGRPANDGTAERMLRGFIMVWAINRDSREIRWNHLSGDLTVVNYRTGAAWSANACAYPVVDATVINGDETGTPGELHLDGSEYAMATELLLLDFVAAGSAAFSGPRLVESNTDLTLMPLDLDVRQESDGPVTTKAHFDVWNANEVKFSGAHRCLTCWDQTLLSAYGIPNHFLVQNLQTDVGKARIDGLASALCDVDFDPGDQKELGEDPRDVVSVNAALMGVTARLLEIDGGQDNAAGGANLVGLGYEAAVIRFDDTSGPIKALRPRRGR